VKPFVAAALVLLAGPGSPEPERWLGVFPQLPGARRLCSQQVLGQSESKRMEITFTLYGSSRDPAEAARFYAKAYGLPWVPGQQSITVTLADGHKILAVHPISASHPAHPDCGVKPASGDRTVVVVSEKAP
jgi:hypothetical protein